MTQSFAHPFLEKFQLTINWSLYPQGLNTELIFYYNNLFILVDIYLKLTFFSELNGSCKYEHADLIIAEFRGMKKKKPLLAAPSKDKDPASFFKISFCSPACKYILKNF